MDRSHTATAQLGFHQVGPESLTEKSVFHRPGLYLPLWQKRKTSFASVIRRKNAGSRSGQRRSRITS